MATTPEYIEFVCSQISSPFAVRYKKMFGEYMVYVNEKPVLLVCDNTVYVKNLPATQDLLADAALASPYKGAKEHFVLDIDDGALVSQVVEALEQVVPLPKPRKKKIQITKKLTDTSLCTTLN